MVLSRYDQAFEAERERTREREMREQMLRDWMKPRIKRLSGAWVCVGRGVTATGFSPRSAYSVWLKQQDRQVMYALQAQPARQSFEGWQC